MTKVSESDLFNRRAGIDRDQNGCNQLWLRWWLWLWLRSLRGLGSGRRRHQHLQEGTVLLDFVDAKTKAMFWRGTATAIAEPGLEAEKQEKNLLWRPPSCCLSFPRPQKIVSIMEKFL